MSWSQASPTVITSRSRHPSPRAGPRSGTSTGCGMSFGHRSGCRICSVETGNVVNASSTCAVPPASSRCSDERHARVVRPELQVHRRTAARALVERAAVTASAERRVGREPDQHLRREVLRAPLDRAQPGRERLVVAAGADRVQPPEAEVLVVDRVRQLVRQDVALGQVEVRVADVDELPVRRVVEPHDLARLEREQRLAEARPRRDHADRAPRLGPTGVEVDRIRLVEVLREAPVDLLLGERRHGDARRVSQPADRLDLLLHGRRSPAASAPRA